ncbi:MAG: HAMP domain-containing protein [Desulfobulbaceae bacterium]|nr:HAMP domain-containing protein [Desulfobulbaceae bacterium]
MRLISKIYYFYGVLLALAVGGALLSWTSSKLAEFHLNRANLANEQLQLYLTLSNDAYQLFKEFSDSILIGELDLGLDESELVQNIKNHIKQLRNIIGYEIQLVGDEEIEELATLATVERMLHELISEHHSILQLKENGTSSASLIQRLAQMYDESIGKRFKTVIREAIEEETAEVEETKRITKERTILFQTVAIIFALISIIFTTIIQWLLNRDIRGPIENLHNGAVVLAAGHFDHRIKITGPGELKDLAKAFNHMAQEISVRETKISRANKNLEEIVAKRTSELEQLLNSLKISQEKRRLLLADVSHELRTPLTIIRGEADIALRGEAKTHEVYREALEKTRSAARHTARLVDDLLFVARQEGGDTRLNFKDIDLVTFLPSILEESRSFTDPESIEIAFTSSLDRAFVSADPDRIRQLILILLENAVHYGGNEIIVDLKGASSGYTVSTTDNGPGMTEPDQVQAFDRFFRGSGAAQRYDKGAGLGLPVAKAIAEAHGGKIEIKSKMGRGTTVSFTLLAIPVLKGNYESASS